jgi:hypothetical protein
MIMPSPWITKRGLFAFKLPNLINSLKLSRIMPQAENNELQNTSADTSQEDLLDRDLSAADAEDDATVASQNGVKPDFEGTEAESDSDAPALVQQNVEPNDFSLPPNARIARRLDELPKYFKQNGFVFIRDGLIFPDPNNIYVWFELIYLPAEVEVVETYYINTKALEGRGLTVAPHSPITQGFVRQSNI